jgi:hypothetical protein
MNQNSLTVQSSRLFGSSRPVGRPTWHVISALCLVVTAFAGPLASVAADVPVAFRNPGMEEGTGKPAAWSQGPPVAGVQFLWDQRTAHSGKASLCLKKTAQRYFPIAQWSQSVSVEPSSTPRKLRVRCWVKADTVTKAIIDVNYQGQGQRPGHSWAVYLGQKQDTDPGLTHDWKLCEGTVEVPAGISKVGIGFQIYGPGSIWFDDLQVTWVRN